MKNLTILVITLLIPLVGAANTIPATGGISAVSGGTAKGVSNRQSISLPSRAHGNERGRMLRLADAVAREIKIPAGELMAALDLFSKQSDIQLIYRRDELEGVRTKGVNGILTAQDAIKKLLEGTKLRLSTDISTGAMLIAESKPAALNPMVESLHVAQAGQTMQKVKETDAPAEGKVSIDGAGSSINRREDPAGSKGIPEVLVKGSRSVNLDIERGESDTQPYYILDAKAIEQSGAANVEEFLKRRLTMNTAVRSNSQGFVSQLGATSSINLRGLGANGTLILINGRRSAGVSYFGSLNQPDINGIALSAIDRIEILPSSASAIYGGAAVGGVINVVLKRQFNGGDVRYSYSNPFSGDAPIHDVSGSYGFSLAEGGTRVMVAVHHADSGLLRMQDRVDFTRRGIENVLRNSPSLIFDAFNPFPGATPNIASANYSTYPTPVNLVLKNGIALNSPITFVSAGTADGVTLSAALVGNAGAYNLNLAPGTGLYGLQNAIGTAPRENSLAATIRQEFGASLEGFAEFSTKSNKSRTLYNPFYTAVTVPESAPTNPFAQNVSVTFPSTLSSPYTTDAGTRSVTVGLLASLPGGWKSEIDYTWSRSTFEFANDTADTAALNAALSGGVLNPFIDTVLYPPDLARYLASVNFAGSSTLNDVNLRIAGMLRAFPWGRATLTFGLEHRKEGSEDGDYRQFRPLNPASNSHTRYFGQSQSTDSIYAEALVQFVTSENARIGLRAFDVQLASRSERYSVETGTALANLSPTGSLLGGSPPQGVHNTVRYTSTNPTIGLKYSPLEDWSFRASYARAFLPPTAAQFLPDARSFCCQFILDPRSGLTYSVNFIQGGNPDLQPQTSKNWNFGLIWEPSQVSLAGLRVNLEHYRITQPDYITSPAAQQVVSNPAYQDRVTRDPVTGRISAVNISYLNALEYETQGWDMKIDYSKVTAHGTFDVHALGTRIDKDSRQYTINGPSLDYVGFPGEGGSASIKANITLGWAYRNWSIGTTSTYFGSYSQVYGSPGSPFALQYGPNATYTAAQGGFGIPSQMYHGVFGSYVFGDIAGAGLAHHVLSGLVAQLSVDNVFDKVPPFDAFYAPYFYSPYGDARMRNYRISVRKSF